MESSVLLSLSASCTLYVAVQISEAFYLAHSL